MAKAARALIALHEGLRDDARQDAGNDYGERHPVGFGGDSLGNGPPLDAVAALGSRRGALVLSISITRRMIRHPHRHPMMRLRMRRIEE